MKRVLYSGVATHVEPVTDPEGTRALLYIVKDPDSGDQLEILLSEDQARRDGRALAAPAGRLDRGQ